MTSSFASEDEHWIRPWFVTKPIIKKNLERSRFLGKVVTILIKFVTDTNSNMLKSMMLSTFSVGDGKYPLHRFGPKNQNCLYRLKFRT